MLEQFHQLLTHLQILKNHLMEEMADYPAWVGESDSFRKDKATAIVALTCFTYESPVPQNTFACPGAIAGNTHTLHLVNEVNHLKDSFKLAVNRYLSTYAKKDTSKIRHLLSKAGYPGIKLKQVYRHIHYVDFHPRRISFTQVKHNSNRKIDKLAAKEKLNKVGQGINIEVQLQQLAKLQSNTLIMHREVLAVWAANISTFKAESERSKTLKIITALPIIYRHDEIKDLPRVHYAKPYQKLKSGPRVDKKIEEHPFLPSIHTYLYKK